MNTAGSVQGPWEPEAGMRLSPIRPWGADFSSDGRGIPGSGHV